MKNKILILLLTINIFFLISCKKEYDDSKLTCDKNCTKISGKIVTSENKPLKDVKLKISFTEISYLYSYTWLKCSTKTNNKGTYNMSFSIKDEELQSIEDLENHPNAIFSLEIDLNNLNPEKYYIDNVKQSKDKSYKMNIPLLLKKDTTYVKSLYIPEKEFITVNLKGFKPIQNSDYFEVQSFIPWGYVNKKGLKKNNNYILDPNLDVILTPIDELTRDGNMISTGNKIFVAETEKQVFTKIPVAAQDTNVIRLIKYKNGIRILKDYKIYVPKNNNINLDFDY